MFDVPGDLYYFKVSIVKIGILQRSYVFHETMKTFLNVKIKDVIATSYMYVVHSLFSYFLIFFICSLVCISLDYAFQKPSISKESIRSYLWVDLNTRILKQILLNATGFIMDIFKREGAMPH